MSLAWDAKSPIREAPIPPAQDSVGMLSSPGLLTLLLVASTAAQAQLQKAESLLNKVKL